MLELVGVDLLDDDEDETEGRPGAVAAVCAEPSIVVVIDTSLANKARTVEAEALELAVAVDETEEVPIHPHHFQHFQLWAFLSKLMDLRSPYPGLTSGADLSPAQFCSLKRKHVIPASGPAEETLEARPSGSLTPEMKSAVSVWQWVSIAEGRAYRRYRQPHRD